MQRAFTLIEIVIVIGLFAIMVLGIAQLYIVFGRVITMQSSSISVTLGGSAIVDTVRVAGLRCSCGSVPHVLWCELQLGDNNGDLRTPCY